MTLAIGGSSSPKPSHGELWVDVRDYGAKADDGITDNSVPFQAAIDDLAARTGGNNKGVVFIPSAPLAYMVSKSVWVDIPNVEIRGEGWGTRVMMSGARRHSVFIFGVRRVERALVSGTWVPLQIGASNRPDLFGKLDTSAAPAAGLKWGLRTNGNSFAQFQASPMSAGVISGGSGYFSDYWHETTKLTVEFCVEPPDGQQFPLGAPLLGLGISPWEPSPFQFSIWDDPKKVLVMFRTADIGPGYFLPNRYFAFSLGSATPPYRIVVQFDLDNAVCTAFVNGVQVAISQTNNLSPTSTYPFAPNSGQRFQQNDFYPFMIGADNVHGPLFNDSTLVDLRVYGLRMSNALRYQNNGAGQPQKRVDSPTTAINDAYAYFGADVNTICFLACTDNPATSGRVVSVTHGNFASTGGTSSGIFLHTPNQGGVIGNAIRDIHVQAGNGYGQAISLGGVLEMTIENVRAVAGFHAIGSFIMYASYQIRIRDCWLEGYDAPYFGATQLIHGRDIYCGRAGKVTFRLLGGNADLHGILVAFPYPHTECIIKVTSYEYGGNFAISSMNVDFEGDTLSLACIYCESIALAPATSLMLKDIFFGSVGAKTALVMLKDASTLGGEYNRSWVSVDNMQAFTADYLAAIDVDGPLWHGEVKGVALGGPQINHRQRWGTKTNVIIRDTKYVAPPRNYLWYHGAHALEVRSPVEGQFAEWRCMATGQYGTPTPPTWVGLNPLSFSTNALAAYLLNHAYMTAALS